MRGDITHVSNPYIITTCNTSSYNSPDFRASAPSFTSTSNNCGHFFRAFMRLRTTAGQSSSDSHRILPRHLKYSTVARGRPYLVGYASSTSLSSPFSSRIHYRSSPFQKRSIEGCRPLRAHCATNVKPHIRYRLRSFRRGKMVWSH